MVSLPLVRSNTLTEKETMKGFNPPDNSFALTDPAASSLSVRQVGPMALVAVGIEQAVILVAKYVAGTAASIGAYIVLPRIYRAILSLLDAQLDRWAKSPPRNQVVLEAGKLRWKFGCSVNPVP